MDDHFLPHRTPLTILEVVHLIEHHHTEALQRGAVGVDHVAQHLGRHNDNGSVSIDDVVAGQ